MDSLACVGIQLLFVELEISSSFHFWGFQIWLKNIKENTLMLGMRERGIIKKLYYHYIKFAKATFLFQHASLDEHT